MKDKVLYIIMGVLIGVVVMQWQQGPETVQAQARTQVPGTPVAMSGDGLVNGQYLCLENGDIYFRRVEFERGVPGFKNTGDSQLRYVGNYWTGNKSR